MKKSRQRQATRPTPTSASAPAGRSGWQAGLILAFAALGVATMLAWRSHQVAARIQAGQPARPDLHGQPAILAQQLDAAGALARSKDTALAGVAQLGRLYQANGFNHEAQACWQILASEQPRDARWRYYLADLRRTESDYPGMANYLAETVALAPDYAPALLRLADLQFKLGLTQEAEAKYAKRLSLIPRDPYARLGLVRIALQRGQREEARRILVELVTDSPQFSPGHNLYAEMLDADHDFEGASRQRWFGRETGRFRDADDPWLEELQAWCYDAKRLDVLGTVDYQTDHGDKGKSFFERAIQYQPDDLSAYELLGTVDLKLGQPEKAREVLESGLSRPNGSKPSPMYFVNLSHAYRELKKPAEAVRVARDALRTSGEIFELFDALGLALGDLGRFDEALAALNHALALSPNDPNANYNVAICLLALGREDDAVAALQHSLVLQPTFPSSLLVLARREMDAGRWPAAETYLRPLYESHPEMPEVRQLAAKWRLQAGKAAEANGNFAEAERQFRAGLASEGNEPELYASLGALYLGHNRVKDAIGPFEAYHRLQPNDPRGALYLGQTYAMNGRLDDARRLLAEGAQMADGQGNRTTADNCREILQSLPPAAK